MRTSRIITLILLTLSLLFLHGCSEDGPANGGDGSDPIIIPEPSPVDKFFGALEIFDITMMSEMLYDDFQLQVLPSTFAKWAQAGDPLDSMSFNRQQTLSMLTNIVNQESGVDWNASIVPPLASVLVQVMDREGTWEPVGEDVEYFGDFTNVYMASHETYYHFKYPGSFWFEVTQTLDIYLIGNQDNEFTIIGFVPHEVVGKSYTDVLSLEDMLSLYR